MTQFVRMGTFQALLESECTAIQDILALDSPNGVQLWIVTAQGAALASFDPLSGMRRIDLDALPISSGVSPNLQLQSSDGEVLLFGGLGQGLRSFDISRNGEIGTSVSLLDTQDTIIAAQQIVGRDETILATVSQATSELICWQANSQGHYHRVDSAALSHSAAGCSAASMVQVANRDETFVVVACAQENSVSVFRIAADGQLQLTELLHAGTDLWVDTPTATQNISVGREEYLLMTASGSGSLVVAQITDQGTLNVTDHVHDSLVTRFEGARFVETISIGEHAFVIAAGGDDGITLMRLLPGGRLLHQHSLADDAARALQNISSISVTIIGDGVHIFVTAEGRQEVTHLQVDASQLGVVRNGGEGRDNISGESFDDILAGGRGNDTLRGAEGDDIIVDGNGTDHLYGGAGADVFTFVADNQTDRIMDFELGVDRIDLSGWGFVYSKQDLRFDPNSDGVVISFQGETLEILSANGRTLRARDFTDEDLFDLEHIHNSLPQAFDDTVNRVYGSAMGDTLHGADGHDFLHGEGLEAESLDAVLGQVFRLYHATLGRNPDAEGHLSWANLIQSGAEELETVSAGFTNSPEFQATYGSLDNREFVTLLYNNVLERAPDPGGLANWVNQLEAGVMHREQVVLGFSESPEFQNQTEFDAITFSWAGYCSFWTGSVFRLYQATLDRLPDVAGLTDWTGRLAQGTSFEHIVSGFVNSAEFRATYGETSNREFVTLLYQNVLNRNPDSTGLEHWISRLEAGGLTREQVVNGFSESVEFIDQSGDELNDYIRSLGKDDNLAARGGDNILFGGRWSDTFVFNATHESTNLVLDIETWDRVELQQFGFETTRAVLDALQQVGNDVALQQNNTSITFQSAQISDFSEDMFVLIG